MMARTFKVMAALLSYPTADIQAAGPELKAVLAEAGSGYRRSAAPIRRVTPAGAPFHRLP